MISAVRTPRSRPEEGSRGGFTLLETMLALSLMGLIVGIGLVFYYIAQD